LPAAAGAASSARASDLTASTGGTRSAAGTTQDVIEALKKMSEEIDAGLSTSRPCKVEAAAHDWLEHGMPVRAHAEGSQEMRWPRS